jgi:hypothetical protein
VTCSSACPAGVDLCAQTAWRRQFHQVPGQTELLDIPPYCALMKVALGLSRGSCSDVVRVSVS